MGNIKGKNNKDRKNKVFVERILLILLLVLLIMFCFLSFGKFIELKRIENKIEIVSQLNEDVEFLGSSYENVEKLDKEIKKLKLDNERYSVQIKDIVVSIEKINVNINNIKQSK